MEKYLEARQAISDAQAERQVQEHVINNMVKLLETSDYTVEFENGAFQFRKKTGGGSRSVWVHLEIEQLLFITSVGNQVFNK